MFRTAASENGRGNNIKKANPAAARSVIFVASGAVPRPAFSLLKRLCCRRVHCTVVHISHLYLGLYRQMPPKIN